jgi:hypothetical protein
MAGDAIERNITPDCPPFFIWQCAGMDDPRNATQLTDVLTACGVPFELHIFPYGAHGTALSNEMHPPKARMTRMGALVDCVAMAEKVLPFLTVDGKRLSGGLPEKPQSIVGGASAPPAFAFVGNLRCRSPARDRPAHQAMPAPGMPQDFAGHGSTGAVAPQGKSTLTWVPFPACDSTVKP